MFTIIAIFLGFGLRLGGLGVSEGEASPAEDSFLLLADGSSKLLLADGVSRLVIAA